MHGKGYGGVLLVDANGAEQAGNDPVPAGPEFGSPAWAALFTHALDVAEKLGLEVTLNITSGWNLGGPGVRPNQASKLLTWSRKTVVPSAEGVTLPEQPAMKNDFFQPIAVLAYPLHQGVAIPGQPGSNRKPIDRLPAKASAIEGGGSMPDSTPLLGDLDPTKTSREAPDATLKEVVDITETFDASGHSSWHPPADSTEAWEVLRIGFTTSDARVSTSSGKWQGLAIDYLDPSALDRYWKHTVQPLIKAAGSHSGHSLKYIATDSWELGGTNWTYALRDEFKRRRGYDPILYLPIVAGRVLDSRGESDRFLTDLRRTVADLVTEHYDHLADLGKPYGIGIQCESGGPHGAPIDALETFRSAAIPQTEYWAMAHTHRSTDGARYFIKEASSASHIYGKPLVAGEGMTSIGNQWSESLDMNLKPSFDMAISEGLNRLVWHTFTSSPASLGLPGQEYFAGTHLNPNVTWWNQAGSFLLYLNRAQFLMQQGQSVSDVLYYYGDNTPNFVRLKSDDPAHVLPGYDYDVTNTDALNKRIHLVGNRLKTPEGVEYRLFKLPASLVLPLHSLQLVASFLRQGGMVVGMRPLRVPGIATADEQNQFFSLVDRIWTPCERTTDHFIAIGKGKIFCNEDTRAAL